jgi:hypothetical protein
MLPRRSARRANAPSCCDLSRKHQLQDPSSGLPSPIIRHARKLHCYSILWFSTHCTPPIVQTRQHKAQTLRTFETPRDSNSTLTAALVFPRQKWHSTYPTTASRALRSSNRPGKTARRAKTSTRQNTTTATSTALRRRVVTLGASKQTTIEGC